MIFSISLFASLIIVMILVLLPKKMHRFELIFNGMFFHYLYTYQFAMFTNVKWITLPSDMDKVLSSMLLRFVIFPVMTLLFLQIYLTLRSLYAKLPLILGFSILFGLIQYVMKWSGMVQLPSKVAIWSPCVWLIILILCIWAMKGFRSITTKEILLP